MINWHHSEKELDLATTEHQKKTWPMKSKIECDMRWVHRKFGFHNFSDVGDN